MSKKFKATLVMGVVYTQMIPVEGQKHPIEIVFEKGKPRVVTEEVKELLEAYAVETVTVRSGKVSTSEDRQKFVFSEYTDNEPEVPKTRTRVAPAT